MMLMRYATLQDVYDAVPDVRCKGKCQDCCGPIGLYGAEAAAIEAAGHALPVVVTHPRFGEETCSALTEAGRCSLYAVRPLVCRLWGAVKAMKCPHGCAPKEWVSEKRVDRLRRRLAELSGSDELHSTLGERSELGKILRFLAEHPEHLP